MSAPSRDGRPSTRQPPVSLVEAVGGVRGVVDGAVPTAAFVAVNSQAGLTAGIVVAIVVAAALMVLRLLRREPVQQAFSGLFAVGVAAFVASRTHSAEGFFLPSIAKNAVFAAVGLLSLLVRRPFAGYVMAVLDPRYANWRRHADTRRAAVWATGVWIAVFTVRFAVQGLLYLAGEPGWLGAANIALGLPLFGVAILATFAIVRRLAPRQPAADDGPVADGGPVIEGTVLDGPGR
ncbi:DUF3159 domain-containing protein [Frankia sp. CiP1_Cm_nod1]|uniref:DUF3159 domain-containing protein n=1 Tax=Frankia sp. CiP1_Cm_nod1 TaxID=2897160 RepID=UPI00202436D9